MILIDGIVAGITATLFFDIFQISLLFAYGINKSNWSIIGRYFINLVKKQILPRDTKNKDEEKNELLIGYIIHYSIGIIFGIFYALCNYIFFDAPSFYLAIFIGISTVIFGWCIMQPFVFNMGFFASKMENQSKIIIQNLLAHYIFGTGLFFGLLAIN